MFDKNNFRLDVNLGELEVSLEDLRKPQKKPLQRTAELPEQGSLIFTFEFVEDPVPMEMPAPDSSPTAPPTPDQAKMKEKSRRSLRKGKA